MEGCKEKNSHNFPNENEESPNNSDKKQLPEEKEIKDTSTQKSEESTDQKSILYKNSPSQGINTNAKQYNLFKINAGDSDVVIEQKKFGISLLDELQAKNLLVDETSYNYVVDAEYYGDEAKVFITHSAKIGSTEKSVIKRTSFRAYNNNNFRELRMLLALGGHPNIIPIKKVFFEVLDVQRIWILSCNMVIPYVPYNLISWLTDSSQKHDRLPTTFKRCMEDVRFVLKQVLEGVSHIHSKEFIHGDIKPTSIRIDDNNQVFLIDFGCCKDNNSVSPAVGGTIGFAAPELFEGPQNGEPKKSFFTPKLDIYSFGVTLFKLFVKDSGSTYPDTSLCTEENVHQRIKTAFPDEPMLEMPENGIEDLILIILSCLDTDPQKRPTAEELLLHPFFSTFPSIIEETPFEKQIEMFKELPWDNEVAIKTKKQITKMFDEYFRKRLTSSEKQGNVYKYYKSFHGGEANVYMVPMKKNGAIKKYAIRAPKDGFFASQDSRILKELKALTELDHPNIIKLERLFFSETDEFFNQNIYEVMPYIEYDFISWLVKDPKNRGYPIQAIGNSKRTLEEVRYVLKQALEAIQFMHNHNWLHLDLKFPNMLIDSNSHCYISDLGFAKNLDVLSTQYPGLTPGCAGPKMLQVPPTSAEKYDCYTTKEDIYSFGVILYRLFVDHTEADVQVRRTTCDNIKRMITKLYQTSQIDERIVEDLCIIIQRCLDPTQIQTPTADDLLEKHPFFSEQKNSIFMKDSKKAKVQDYLPNIFDTLKTYSDSQALFMTGVFYENGWGVAKDSKLAFQCFKQAADNGNANAQFKVGDMYGKGILVLRNDEIAKEYFELAAQQGHKEAMEMLAEFK